MIGVFRRYILEKIHLTEEEFERVMSLSIQKKIRKKQFLLHMGDVSRYNCFVVKGCLRLFGVSENGNEHILRFAVEDWWISDRESYNTGRPSKYNIEALENTDVILWSKEDFERLKEEIPQIEKFTNKLLTNTYHTSQNRIYNLISSSVEENYQQFIDTYPNISKKAPLHMITSYLGVTRETLSRVRQQFAQKISSRLQRWTIKNTRKHST